MDFGKIFNAYTNNTSLKERSQILSNIPILSTEDSQIIGSINSNSSASDNYPGSNEADQVAADPTQNEVDPSVLEILSELDTMPVANNNLNKETPISSSDNNDTFDPLSSSDNNDTFDPLSSSDNNDTFDPLSSSDNDDTFDPLSSSDNNDTFDSLSSSDNNDTFDPLSSSDNDDTFDPLSSSDNNDTFDSLSSSDNNDTFDPLSSSNNDDTFDPLGSSDNDDTFDPLSSSDNDDTFDPLGSSDNDQDSYLDNFIENNQDSSDNFTNLPTGSNPQDEFDIELPDDWTVQDTEPKETTSPEQSEEDFMDNISEDNISDIDHLSSEPSNQTVETVETNDTDFIDEEPISDDHSNDIHSNLDLNDNQIFLIREKINSLKNKDLRFKLRNIVLDPIQHKEYFDELISLLMINSPESTIEKFLDKYLTVEELDITPIESNSNENRAVFFADDVANFEQLKLSIIKTVQKSALYLTIIMLIGSISWIGVAQPINIYRLYNKGLNAIKNNNFKEGEALFKYASQILGKPDASWSLKYGDSYAEKKLLNLAEQKYLIAIQVKPSDIQIGTHVSDFYTNLGIERYPNAANILSNLTKQHPSKFEVWDYNASLYRILGDLASDPAVKKQYYFTAKEIYNNFIINNINQIAPYYKMIELCIKLDNNSQIKKIMTIINQINPKYRNIDTLTKLAEYYTDRKLLTDSSQVFKQLIPCLNNFKNKFNKLKSVMDKQFNIPNASISNILSSSFYEYARYQLISSQLGSAAELLTNSIRLNESNYQSYNLLGEALLALPNQEQRTAEATELFKKSMALNSTYYKPYLNLGHIDFYWNSLLLDNDQIKNQALYNYRQAKRLIPKNRNNYLLNYNLGWLEYYNNNLNNALDLWSEIYTEDFTNPNISYAMGTLLFKLGNPQLSQVELTKTADELNSLVAKIPEPNKNNKRHMEIFTQLSKTCNNLGVIYANFARSNPGRKEYFETQALLHFYNSKDKADQINTLYNITEYNIGVMTRQNIPNRSTEFDFSIPKNTSLENINNTFKDFLIDEI
ncbi:MAG: hypothetical protein ACRCTQ_02285 [Brevinemataceae bacterium]